MNEINRRYFEGLMADQGLSLRGLAKKMDMNHSQLSLALGGTRKFQLEEVAKISSIFGEPLHRVVENAGVSVRPVSGRMVPVVGAMQGDGTVATDEDAIERASAPEDLPEDAMAVQCRTAGTPLDWADSWVLFFRSPQQNVVDPAVLGRLSYCKIRKGPAVIATVRRGYREGTHTLSGFYNKESASLEFAVPVLVIRP
jgi:hypothetical protein